MACTIFNRTCAILAIAFVGVAFHSNAQATEKVASASCYRQTAGGPCKAAWDFSSTPRSFFFIERFEFDAEKTNWRRVEGPVAGFKTVSNSSVEGGYLHRVVGCTDKAGAVNCSGSTVFWAPSRPDNLDDIPDEVRSPAGYYLRDRSHSRELQILDYNIALMSTLISTVDMTTMPAMTNLPFSDLLSLPLGIFLEDATLDYNVHAIYELAPN